MQPYIIRRLATGDPALEEASDLVWRVFSVFEAPDYTKEGIAEFRDFIAPSSLSAMQREGSLLFWACFDGSRVIGLLALRPPGHISLLFVETAYHRQGIARALWETALSHCRSVQRPPAITVHASPYAKPVYERLGFVPTGCEREENGIRFIPMTYTGKEVD